VLDSYMLNSLVYIGRERWWAYTWWNNNYQWSTWFDWKGKCCNSPAT